MNLIVGRDRAHVKVLSEQFPRDEVISASAFFDKVRALAFVADGNVCRMEYAPMMFAHHVLAQNRQFPLWYASRFASLFSACYHGTMSPCHIAKSIAGQDFAFEHVFTLLAAIDTGMTNASIVNGVSALYHAWQIIRNKHVLPLGLARSRLVVLWHLVDLTVLEIEVIKDLSRLGLRFDICFPLDFQARGINAAVDFSAKLFEAAEDLVNVDVRFDNIAKSGPLLPLTEGLFKENAKVTLSEANCSINAPYDIVDEANQIGAKTAEIIRVNPSASIAVLVRSIDGRAKIYQHALKRYGIAVRDRKGIPYLETEIGSLVSTILSAKLKALPKKDIIALIHHPQFCYHLSDDIKKTAILDMVRELGIDDRLTADPKSRYQQAFAHWRALANLSDEKKANLAACVEFLNNVEGLLDLLPKQASFSDHLSALSLLLSRAIVDNDSLVLALQTILVDLKASAMAFTSKIAIDDFTSLLLAELAKVTVPRADVDDVNAVEFLLLPELLGRKFDHVFIADISFGRMPKNSEPDPLMDDQARMALNKWFKKPILRVFQDDPFEPLPVPPRQALEPFWFASGIAAAQTSIHFYCASHDESGAEQAPSEFFLWLKEHVTTLPRNDIDDTTRLVRPVELRFLQGVLERSNEHLAKSPSHQALLARKAAFLGQGESPWAFKISKEQLLASFNGRLGDHPTKALTPTMVEAFASCRFKGWSERNLLVLSDQVDQDDMDARVVGQIAHRALEVYFHESKKDAHPDRELLARILAKVGKVYASENFIHNHDVFACHLEWLNDALFSLLHRMSTDDVDEPKKTLALELAFGLSRSKWPPISIDVDGRRYLLGGRVDRVDQEGDRLVVVDYKLSALSTLRLDVNQKNLLRRHFQMPIYVRLVGQYLAKSDPGRVSFSFASIRDGQVLKVATGDLIERIYDDQGELGLGRAIDRIFAPIMEGELVATAGEHCHDCELSYFCRKAEGETHD